MARGLLHGATIVMLIGFISVLFATFSPMWMVLRTELEEKQCWHGEGIWTSRYFWGSDLPLAGLKCKDPHNIGPLTTTDAYCNPTRKSLNRHDPVTYNHDMCSATKHAKITSIIACVFSFLATATCVFMGMTGGVATSSTYWSKSCFRPMLRRQEFLATMFALGCSVGTTIFTLTTCAIMFNSPLFSEAHRDALSKTQIGLPFKGLGSCSFQTPVHSVFTLFRSAPMICLFVGPSFFTTLIIFLCQCLGSGFLGLLAYDIWIRRRHLMKQLSVQQPLLSGSSLAISSWDEQQTSPSPLGEDDMHDDVLPASFRKVRRYSMYGAAARRFSKLGFVPKFCVLTFAPVFFMVGNAVSWATYSMLGVQIIVAAEMSLIDRKTLLESPLNGTVLVAPIEPPQYVKDHILEGFLKEHKNFYRDVLNVFNFSPVTSLQFFWDNGAILIAIAVFFAILVIPIFKVVCWIWLFYAPSDEIHRGRILDVLDFIGKYSLANLYALCFLAVTLCFDSDFIMIPLGDVSFLLKVRSGITAGNGIGSYMFVITSILSLLIGQCMVWFHSLASTWEEDRRARHGLNFSAADTPLSSGTTQTALSADEPPTSMLESPNYTVGDTPFMDSGMNALGFAAAGNNTGTTSEFVLDPSTSSSRRNSENLTGGAGVRVVRFSEEPPTRASSAPKRNSSGIEILPTFRSLASFGSTVDLEQMGELPRRAGSGQQLAQTHQPEIMRALASFGSRTALNVLAARAQRQQRNTSAAALNTTIEEEDEEDEDDDEEQETGRYVDVRLERRSSVSGPLHPYVEAMCDRVHSPLQGTRLRWTPTGKVVVWILIFILSGFMLVCQSWDLVEIHKTGVTGDIIVKPSKRYQLYSLVSLTGAIADTGFEVPAFELSGLFFLMTAVMPCCTVLGMAMMWTIPMTLDQQCSLFTWLEIVSAWSSLDIFFISMIAMYVELSDVTDKIIVDAIPKISELIRLIMPWEAGVLSAELKLKDGFWVLLLAVILEKIALYFITEQTVTAISERRAEKFLRDLAKQSAKLRGDSDLTFSPGSWNGGPSSQTRLDTGLLGDAAEGLLETEAMLVFAPVGRYTSAMFPRTIYAGLPRSWWVRVLVRLGLLADAKTVERYYQTGEWFNLDESHIPPPDQGLGGDWRSPLLSPPITSLASSPGFENKPRSSKKQATASARTYAASSDHDAAAGEQIVDTTVHEKHSHEQDLTKKVSWGRLDDHIDDRDSGRVSFGEDEDGPLSF